ncbi:MAG: hypothetical protein NT079_06250, partial [Candidatus Omnitrophica bacterium]|nr:hypothetical protein [Candidatus Omnitrophota bacterium]
MENKPGKTILKGWGDGMSFAAGFGAGIGALMLMRAWFIASQPWLATGLILGTLVIAGYLLLYKIPKMNREAKVTRALWESVRGYIITVVSLIFAFIVPSPNNVRFGGAGNEIIEISGRQFSILFAAVGGLIVALSVVLGKYLEQGKVKVLGKEYNEAVKRFEGIRASFSSTDAVPAEVTMIEARLQDALVALGTREYKFVEEMLKEIRAMMDEINVVPSTPQAPADESQGIPPVIEEVITPTPDVEQAQKIEEGYAKLNNFSIRFNAVLRPSLEEFGLTKAVTKIDQAIDEARESLDNKDYAVIDTNLDLVRRLTKAAPLWIGKARKALKSSVIGKPSFAKWEGKKVSDLPKKGMKLIYAKGLKNDFPIRKYKKYAKFSDFKKALPRDGPIKLVGKKYYIGDGDLVVNIAQSDLDSISSNIAQDANVVSSDIDKNDSEYYQEMSMKFAREIFSYITQMNNPNRKYFNFQPFILFERASIPVIDKVFLIRTGEIAPMTKILAAILSGLSPLLTDLKMFALTSMPWRFDMQRESALSLMTRKLADTIGIEFINENFYETRVRPSMTLFPEKGRAEALMDVMKYRGDLSSRIVILMDDVMTTGTSLLFATRALLDAGASFVIPVALLRTPESLVTWEKEQTKRVVRQYFKVPYAEIFKRQDVTHALKQICQELITEFFASQNVTLRNLLKKLRFDKKKKKNSRQIPQSIIDIINRYIGEYFYPKKGQTDYFRQSYRNEYFSTLLAMLSSFGGNQAMAKIVASQEKKFGIGYKINMKLVEWSVRKELLGTTRLWATDFDGTLYAGPRNRAIISKDMFRLIALWLYYGGDFRVITGSSFVGQRRDRFDLVAGIMKAFGELGVPEQVSRYIVEWKVKFNLSNNAIQYSIQDALSDLSEKQLSNPHLIA